MAAPQGIVRVYRHDQAAVFQVEGWTTMNQSLSFRRAAEQCLASGVTALQVDLRRCTFMDSTFIGTLLCLKRTAHGRKQGEFVLLAPSPQCCQLFQQMGLEGVFPVKTCEELPASACTELGRGAEDAGAFRRNVVQAHEELANLEGPAGEPFRAVVRCLQQDEQSQQPR
jgi:anti-anti-sigma factor